MTNALRPMSTGEVLDRTFNLYRNNFQLFAGISTIFSLLSLIGVLAAFILGIGAPGVATDLRNPGSLIGFVIVVFVGFVFFYLIGYALSMGATVYGVSQVHLGNRTTIKECYRRIRPQMWTIIRVINSVFWRIVGASLLSYLLVILLAFAAVAVRAGGLALVIGSCGLIIGIVWVLSIVCKYALAVPACLLEKVKGGAALQRSRELAQGSLFRIFIVLLLVGVLNYAFSYALQYPGRIFAGTPSLFIGWNLLASFIASTLSFPIGNIAYSLLYYDQRIRKEAFDLQLMMEAVGEVPQGQSAAAAPSIG